MYPPQRLMYKLDFTDVAKLDMQRLKPAKGRGNNRGGGTFDGAAA